MMRRLVGRHGLPGRGLPGRGVRALASLVLPVAFPAVLLAGCSVHGPDYRRPEGAAIARPEAQGAFVGGDSAAFTPAPVPDDWWRLYADPRLDALIEQALAANTDLRVAAANLARADAALDAVASDRRVQAGVNATTGYAQRSAEEELLPGSPLAPHMVYALGASVSYQLDLTGQIARAIEASDADRAATQAAYDSVRVTVVANTTAAYLDACAAGREADVARRAIALQQRGTELTRRLAAAGREGTLAVRRAAAQEAEIRASLPEILARRQMALYRLAVLTGRPPAAFDRDVAQCVAEPRLARPIPIGDGAALLARRPDVRRAEAELHATTARIGVAEGDLYPHITLGASAGSVGLAENLLASDSFKFSLGPLIHWQFPDRTRARANIAGAHAAADAAYARFDGVVLHALEETEVALTGYGRDLDRRAALTDARDEGARAYADAQRLYRAGRIGALELLDAERTLVALEQQVAAADTQVAADQVRLFLALGGGWRDPDTAAPAIATDTVRGN